MVKKTTSELNLDVFGLAAAYLVCTGIDFQAQRLCEFFEPKEDKKSSPCKFVSTMIENKECSHPEARRLAFDHKNPEHYEAGMRETFHVRSAKYQRVIEDLHRRLKEANKEAK